MDDQRIGSIARAVRRRRQLRQVDVAVAAGVAQITVSRLERGQFDLLSLRSLRAILSALEIRIALNPSWRGPDLDRLLDEDHAILASAVVTILEQMGWDVAVEVTYSHYGERGSIDILAAHIRSRTVLVIEIKTQLVSVEETVRRLDQKERLAAQICVERFGWRPSGVAKLLVLPEASGVRRRWNRYRALLDRAFPSSGGRAVRHWLARPVGPFSGVWFLSSSHPRTTRSIRKARSHVRGGPRGAIRAGAVDPSR